MTLTEFVKELRKIVGVRLTGEHDGRQVWLRLWVNNIVVDCFSIKQGELLNGYMAAHYINMLANLLDNN